jgi:hypothetical protein
VGAILYTVAQNWPRAGQETNWNLLGVTLIVLAMASWLVVEAVFSFLRGRGNLGLPEDEFVSVQEAPDATASSVRS